MVAVHGLIELAQLMAVDCLLVQLTVTLEERAEVLVILFLQGVSAAGRAGAGTSADWSYSVKVEAILVDYGCF
jgi:hypothetical protein